MIDASEIESVTIVDTEPISDIADTEATEGHSASFFGDTFSAIAVESNTAQPISEDEEKDTTMAEEKDAPMTVIAEEKDTTMAEQKDTPMTVNAFSEGETVQFEQDSTVMEATEEPVSKAAVFESEADTFVASEMAIPDIFAPPSAMHSTNEMDTTTAMDTIPRSILQFTEDDDAADGLEALIERIVLSRQEARCPLEGRALRHHHNWAVESDSIFKSYAEDELSISEESIGALPEDSTEAIPGSIVAIPEAVLPYDLRDAASRSETEPPSSFLPRRMPSSSSEDAIVSENNNISDDPFGIHVLPIPHNEESCVEKTGETDLDDGIANCSGCLFPTGWSPVLVRRPSAFALFRSRRQRERQQQKQQQHRQPGLLPDAQHPLQLIEQQRRGSAPTGGTDPHGPPPHPDGRGLGPGGLEQRPLEKRPRGPSMFATPNASALDMLLQQYRNGRRAVHRPDERDGDESTAVLQHTIQQQREQHRRGQGTGLPAARPLLSTTVREEPGILGGIRQRFSSLINTSSTSSSSSEGPITRARRSISNFFASTSASSGEEESSGLFPGLSLLFSNRSASVSTTAASPSTAAARPEMPSLLSRFFK